MREQNSDDAQQVGLVGSLARASVVRASKEEQDVPEALDYSVVLVAAAVQVERHGQYCREHACYPFF